jgi:uncharacterized membrane protein
MTNEIDLEATATKKQAPWGITLVGLFTIAAIIVMPFIAGKPDGKEMPDMVRFLGNFHPVVLHLPIGIFMLILFQELLAIVTRKKDQSGIFPIFFGASSAVLAVILGFLLYQGGGFEGSELVEDHLWGGIAFSSLAILAFIVKSWSMSAAIPQTLYQTMVALSVLVMTYASHDGASITHGENHLTEYAPDPIRKLIGLPPKEKKGDKKDNTKPLEEQIVFADIVQPILEKRCVECHKEGKSKGKFRMDTFDLLVKGGKEGDGLIPGDADKSNIIYRAELPEDDDEHMPPEGKPDLEEHELAVIKWWINEGADPTNTVAQLTLSDEIREAIGKLDLGVSFAEAGTETTSEGDTPSDELRAMVAKLGENFPGGLTFESQSSSKLTFTGVSMRASLNDEEFAKLTPVIGKMVAIDLSATSITDASVSLLASAENLRIVRLPETQITDAALDTLSQIKSLESLNLYGTKITDAGAKKLVSLTKLKRLYLWQTKVSPEVIAELKAAIPGLEISTGI